jgi:hypothetical protein
MNFMFAQSGPLCATAALLGQTKTALANFKLAAQEQNPIDFVPVFVERHLGKNLRHLAE